MANEAPTQVRSHAPPENAGRGAIRYVWHASYDDPQAVRSILESIPDGSAWRNERGSRREDAATARSLPPLTVERERSLFMRMNCLKHLAAKRLHASHSDLERRQQTADRLLGSAREIRDQILTACQGLVISTARRMQRASDDVEELISEANLVLLAAVDSFDCHRGFRFSTYATHSIQRHLARWSRRRMCKRMQEAAQDPISLSRSVSEPTGRVDRVEAKRLADRYLALLSPADRSLVERRFGLGSNPRPHTLREIGEQQEVSGESVRQRLHRIMRRLREAAETEPLLSEFPH
ncbi:MAG: hypothetical protein DWQ45_19410 [Planctomycetota bacterium]|nr:MAG: hypothetical protein DWQ41_02360 [Planctomycetota bacterium]REK31498.1 MAG: hypothetical protein DWQ45_19410 [Planctomycetota bacterium]